MKSERQQRYDGLVERAAPGTHEAISSYIFQLNTPLSTRFCDIAAGNGALIARLRGKGFKNFVAVEWNVKDFRLPELTPIAVDLNLPFSHLIKQNHLFEFVTAVEIIEHLENPRAFLAEIRDSLEPGGKLLVTTPNLGNWPARLKFLLTGQLRHFLPVDIKAQRHITPILDYQMEAALHECGFKLIKTFHCGSTYGPLKLLFMKMIDFLLTPIMRGKTPLKEVTVYHAEVDGTISTRKSRDYFNDTDFKLDDNKL